MGGFEFFLVFIRGGRGGGDWKFLYFFCVFGGGWRGGIVENWLGLFDL